MTSAVKDLCDLCDLSTDIDLNLKLRKAARPRNRKRSLKGAATLRREGRERDPILKARSA